jgi:hypothetical protein
MMGLTTTGGPTTTKKVVISLGPGVTVTGLPTTTRYIPTLTVPTFVVPTITPGDYRITPRPSVTVVTTTRPPVTTVGVTTTRLAIPTAPVFTVPTITPVPFGFNQGGPVNARRMPTLEEVPFAMGEAPTPMTTTERPTLEKLVGAGEAGLSILSGMIGQPAAAVYSVGKAAIAPNVPIKERGKLGEETMKQVSPQLMYQPKTEAGQEALQGVAKFMQESKLDAALPQVQLMRPMVGPAAGQYAVQAAKQAAKKVKDVMPPPMMPPPMAPAMAGAGIGSLPAGIPDLGQQSKGIMGVAAPMMSARQVGKTQVTKAFDEADNLPQVDFDETPEGKDIVGQIRSAWIGGVGDFGNQDAAYTLFQFPEGREYIKQTQNIAQKTLGNEFMGYRLMSREQFEDLQSGDVGNLMSFSLSRQAAENLRNFAPNQKRKDLVVVEAPLTPQHVVMFGSRGEQEVVVDSSVGWDMSKMKIASGPISKQDLDTSLLIPAADRPFVGELERRVADLKGPMTKSQFLGFLKGNQAREHEMVRAKQALEGFGDNDKLSPAQIMEAIRPTSPNRYKLQIVEPSQKNQKDFYQDMDNPYPSNPIGTVNLLMDPNQQQKQMRDLYNKAITESGNVLTNLRQNQTFNAQTVSDTIDELYSVVKNSDPRLAKQGIIEYKNELVSRLSDFAGMQKLVQNLLSGTDLFAQKAPPKNLLDIAKNRFGYSDEQLSQMEAGTKPFIGLFHINSLRLFEELAQKQKEFIKKNASSVDSTVVQKAEENARENAPWKTPILEAIEADRNGSSIGLSMDPPREAYYTLTMGPKGLPEVRDTIDNISRQDLKGLESIFSRLSSKLQDQSTFYEGSHPSVASENPISFARFVDLNPQTYNISDPRGAMFFTELQSDRYRDVKPLKVKLVEKTITDAQGNTRVKQVPEINPATGKPVMIKNDKYKPDLEPAYPGMADISSDLVQQLMIKNAVAATTQRGKGIALFPSTDSSQAQLYENVGRNVKQAVKDLGPGFKAQQFDVPNEKGDIIKRWGIMLPPDAQSIIGQKGVRFAKGGLVDKPLYDRNK